ncbi:MAG: hypothetical protein V1777_05715 [Candidatus Micrarchaeota archaeon]
MLKLGFSKRRTGQIGIEFLSVAAVLLAIVAVLAGLSFLLFSDSVATSQTNDAVLSLTNSINHVYRQGTGNAVTVRITLPQNLKTSFVGGLSGKEIGFTLATTFGDQNFFSYTDANVAGSLPIIPGTFLIRTASQDLNVWVQQVG